MDTLIKSAGHVTSLNYTWDAKDIYGGSYENVTGNDTTNLGARYNITDQLRLLDEHIRQYLPENLQKVLLERIESSIRSEIDKTDLMTSASESTTPKTQITLSVFDNSYPTVATLMPSSFSSWSFAQGLIVGQLSVIVVLFLFVKFFFFGEGSSKHAIENSSTDSNSPIGSSSSFMAPPLLSATTSRLFSTLIKRGGKDGSSIVEDKENERTRQINSILEKTYYDVETHAPESLDWFNVLIAQTIQQFREEALLKDNIIHSLDDFIARKSSELPNYLDCIKITELDIGDDFPIFSNCRIQYSPNLNKRRLEAKIDIDLRDRFALGIETKLLFNYPKPLAASLPVQLTVSMVRFQACLTVSLTTAEEFVSTMTDTSENPNEAEHGHYLVFSFSPDYKMEYDIKTLIGARSKLENIPKISSLVEYQIRKWFMDRCVEPRFQFVKLPSMWPRSKNTREEKTAQEEELSKASGNGKN
ncbi:HHR009Cp [Eremothecium sinecaudum]|uniref:Maintenance of mitochondrial morphology protein 1 n=1 Tax=Eremothecium sinecaudum TaxID=45286 RepID=A0A0X8HWM5_9SACH|nr:HHR009Cp [Eremothecium sinecaudum]AMD22778.1 HHR009Cp [Eremothecium sinecaudum]